MNKGVPQKVIFCSFRLNSKRNTGRKLGIGVSKTVSRRRLFNKISDDKLKQLQTKQIKRRSFAKMQWAVRAYNEW